MLLLKTYESKARSTAEWLLWDKSWVLGFLSSFQAVLKRNTHSSSLQHTSPWLCTCVAWKAKIIECKDSGLPNFSLLSALKQLNNGGVPSYFCVGSQMLGHSFLSSQSNFPALAFSLHVWNSGTEQWIWTVMVLLCCNCWFGCNHFLPFLHKLRLCIKIKNPAGYF